MRIYSNVKKKKKEKSHSCLFFPWLNHLIIFFRLS